MPYCFERREATPISLNSLKTPRICPIFFPHFLLKHCSTKALYTPNKRYSDRNPNRRQVPPQTNCRQISLVCFLIRYSYLFFPSLSHLLAILPLTGNWVTEFILYQALSFCRNLIRFLVLLNQSFPYAQYIFIWWNQTIVQPPLAMEAIVFIFIGIACAFRQFIISSL